MQVEGHVFLETAYAKRTYWYFGFRTSFTLGLSRASTAPNPSPFVRTRKPSTSQCRADSHGTSKKHRRGFMPRNSGQRLAFLLLFHCEQPSRVKHGCPRERGQRCRERLGELGRGRRLCGIKRKRRHRRPLNFAKEKK